MHSRLLHSNLYLLPLLIAFAPSCHPAKPKRVMTDQQRLANLLEYLRDNGFALQANPAAGENWYTIEQGEDGSAAVTGFVVFSPASEDTANQQKLLDRNLSSVYNPRCKVAMFVPGIIGPPSTPDGWKAPPELLRHANRDAAIIERFLGYDPGP